jgi:phosphatidylglycerophosphate synthase
MSKVAVTDEPGAPAGFSAALRRLSRAQKSSRGAPAYSLYINRPLGRVLAAAAYSVGLSPNQVTAVSAVFTFAGLAVLALGPATVLIGLLVAVLLVLGYALDSADGQLARLRGGGSLGGEWLDHTVDSVKVVAFHLVVLVVLYRGFDLDPRWLLVPLAFAVASSVHFFGMILVDLFRRLRIAEAGGPAAAMPAPSRLSSLLKVPTDYGVLCLAMLLLGSPGPFLAVYTVLAAAMVGYTALVLGKWRRDIAHLERGGRP